MGIGYTDLKCPICGEHKLADMDGVMECMACGAHEISDKNHTEITGWFIPYTQFKKIFTDKRKIEPPSSSLISGKDQELCKQALRKWGLEFQLVMLAEQFSELFSLLSKKLRGRTVGHLELIDEFADTQIMLEQMMQAFGADEKTVRNYRAMKLGRLEELLGKEKQIQGGK